MSVKYTKHARSRMDEMGVSEGEVESAIQHPLYSYSPRRYPGTTTHVARRIAVSTRGPQVETILWSDLAMYDIVGRK